MSETFMIDVVRTPRRIGKVGKGSLAHKSRLALRDCGAKRDIADAALFLSSDKARYFRGVLVDRGLLLGEESADALTLPERAK